MGTRRFSILRGPMKRKCYTSSIMLLTMLIIIYFRGFYDHQFEFNNLDYAVNNSLWKQGFWISGQNICREAKPYLLLLILSIPKSSGKRDAIRETWTKTDDWPEFKIKISIKTVFLFGEYAVRKDNDLIAKESEKYGDVVVGKFVDSYRNLTLKVLSGIYWVKRYCAGAKFVVKMDDDTFINIPLLYKHLEMKPRLNYTIFGYLIMKGLTERSGKYAVRFISYPNKFYPPYTSGNMYIATPRTFFALLDAASHERLFVMEDVFITGILAKIANVSHRAFPQGSYLPRKAAKACEFVKNTKLYSKDYDSKDIKKAWNIIREGRKTC